MTTAGIILGCLIGANILLAAANRNLSGICGWLVAGMEWMRRM